MAYAQDVTGTERQARSTRIAAMPVRFETLAAYLVFASSIGFAAACVLGLIP